MIESCPRKRMFIGITILGVLTLIVLIAESKWTEENRSRHNHFIQEHNSTCWKTEKYEIIKECEPCDDFAIKSKSSGVCQQTHYKEILKCSSGEIVVRSCDRVAYIEEYLFWRFEAFMFIFSCISTFCVVSRKKVLNKRMLQRVQRQLANSV